MLLRVVCVCVCVCVRETHPAFLSYPAMHEILSETLVCARTHTHIFVCERAGAMLCPLDHMGLIYLSAIPSVLMEHHTLKLL